MSSLNNHSQELKDIIEQPQSKNSIFVYCFLFLFILLLIFLGFTIKSPDMIIADAKISSSNPPIVLKSKSVGRIHIIADSIPISAKAYQYLAIINNAANYSDVQKLKNALELGWPVYAEGKYPDDTVMQIGELSSCYFSLKNAALKYRQLIDKKNIYHQKEVLYLQRLEYDTKVLLRIKQSLANSISQLEIKEKQYKQDSILFTQNAITKKQFQESRLDILNSQKYLIIGQEEVLSKEQSIEENRQQIEILRSEYTEILENTKLEMETQHKKLLAQIREWEDKYVFMSASSCIVEWANILSEGDYVEIGEPVFNCVSPDNTPYAIAVLPGEKSGKVKVGQSVNIKLEAFPFSEYGTLTGYVDRISLNSIDRSYLIYISLPKGLISSTGEELSFAETIYGQAEIITEKRRLITRIYHHVYDILNYRERIVTRREDENIDESNKINF